MSPLKTEDGLLAHTPAGYRDAPYALWWISAQPHVMIKIKRVFPRMKPTASGQVSIVDTPEVAFDIRWFCERHPLRMLPTTAAHLAAQADRYQARREAVDDILAGSARLELPMEPARTPRRYQLEAAAMVRAGRRLLLADDVGLGKAQPLDAPVLTPTGFRPIGELAVGDAVTAADGTTTCVVGVYPQGELDCYRVTFSDGATVECSDEHLWRVRHSRRARSKVTGELCPPYWQTLTLRQILGRGLFAAPRSGQRRGQAKWHIPMITAPELGGAGSLPLDPYLLGVLLGDGGLTGSGVTLTTADAEVLDLLRDRLPDDVKIQGRGRYRFDLTHCPEAPDRCTEGDDDATARGLCGKHYQRAVKRHAETGEPLPPKKDGRHPIIRELRHLGLWGHSSLDKFIPDPYLHASAADRLALLQGLMDTDGYALPIRTSATAQFSSSSRRLADGARWLVESLGGVGRLTSKFAHGRDRYTVTVKLPQPLNPFRLTRKASVWGDGHATLRPTRAIIDVQPVGRRPMQCIAIAHPDRLYVTDRFVVTHNTTTALLTLADPDALPALVVCPTNLPGQWLRELVAVWPMLIGHAVTGTRPYDLSRIRGLHGHTPDVLVMGYSKLAGWGGALAGKVRTVIFDEAHELRTGTDTDKGAAAAHVSHAAEWVIGCSATPSHGVGSEIWHVMHAIDPTVLGSKEEFLREWGGGTGPGGKPLVRDPAALGSFLRSSGAMLRRTRRDVHLELPEPLRIRQEVESDPAALSEVSDTVLALARLILDEGADRKARFVAAGNLDWRLRHATGVAKAPYVAAFVRMLAESEKKIVLFAWHRTVWDILREQLASLRPVLYTGSESARQKDAAVEAFVHGDARVLMMSLRSGAGLDGLQEVSSTVVFGELDWSGEAHTQAIGRLARDGQESTVAAYFLVSNQGSDPVVEEVLQLKRMQSEPIRDPDLPVLAPVAANLDRTRLLARAIVDAHDARARGQVVR